MKIFLLVYLSTLAVIANCQTESTSQGGILNIPSSSFIQLNIKGDKDAEIVKKFVSNFFENKKRFIISNEKAKYLMTEMSKELTKKVNDRFLNSVGNQQIESYYKKLMTEMQPVYFYLTISYVVNLEKTDTLFANNLEWSLLPAKLNFSAADINLLSKKKVDIDYLIKTPLLTVVEQILTLITQK